MANRAFAIVSGWGSPAANGSYVLVDDTDTVINQNAMSCVVTWSDDIDRILVKLADNIRSNNSDPSIEVFFVGGVGSY